MMNNKRKTFKQLYKEAQEEEMILKKDSELSGEYKTIKLLRKLWKILLLLGVIFEFIGCEMPHKDFIVNLLLGASVSAFVSFITLYVPFKNKKTNEKNEFNLMLRNIYALYNRMYTSLQCCKCDHAQRNSEELLEKIEMFKIMYSEMNFYSSEFQRKEKIATESLKDVIIDVNYYIEALNIFLNEKEDLKYYGKEDYEYLQKELYSLVVNHIDEYKIPNICSELEILNEETANLSKWLEDFEKAFRNTYSLKRGILIRNEIHQCYTEITNKLLKKKMNSATDKK